MNKMLTIFAAAAFAVSSLTAEEFLIGGWNFNDTSDAPASQMVVNHGAGTMTTNWAPENIVNFTGNSINLVPGDAAGSDIALRNGGDSGAPANEGNWVQFQIDMTEMADLQFSYAGRTTSSGMRKLTWSWSIDGTNFTDLSTVDHFDMFGGANYGLVELDLSVATEVNGQAEVFIRGTFSTPEGQTNTSAFGNTRLDNVQFRTSAPSIPGSATLTNATSGSDYSGTALFASDATQSVALTVTGADPTPLTTVEISLPEGWSGLSIGNVGLSGSGYSGASPSVSGDILTISNAAVTDSATGTVIINGLATPAGEAIPDWGRFSFPVRAAVSGEALDNIGGQPKGNLVIPVSLVRQVNAQGVPLSVGQRVAVAGVATVASEVFNIDRFATYLQDDTGGVAIDSPTPGEIWSGAAAGSRYTAVGTVGQFRGLTQIEILNQDDFIEQGADTMPEPLLLTISELLADAETLEGSLVRLARVWKTAGAWPNGENATLTITAAGSSSPLTLFINRLTDNSWSPEPEWPADVVGILGQYTTATPSLDGYQIVPRAYSDFLPPSDIAGGFEQWRADFFPGQTGDPGVSGPDADPDGDGLRNLLEYALGGNPHENSRRLHPAPGVAGGFLEITFQRVRDATNIIYRVKASGDLSGWTEIWNSTDFPYTSPDPVAEETVSDVVPIDAAAGRQLMLEVIQE